MDVQTAATIESLKQQLDAARAETDRIRSALQREYDHSKNLETSLNASKSSEAAYRADVVRLTAERDASRQACNDIDRELARAMLRAEVLAAEVKAWREFEDVSIDTSWHNAWCDSCDRIETVKSHTDRTHAMDAAKFEGKP